MDAKKNFATIGYGKTKIQQFIQILVKYKINCIVDVRSSPYSKYDSAYIKENFEAELTKNNIAYKWLGEKLGGRPPEDLPVYFESGSVDYVKLTATNIFQEGLRQLEELSLAHNIAIMCSEGNPLECHRFLAISRELSRRDYKVFHILNMGTVVKHAALEDVLVKLHNGDCIQLDLFNNDSEYILDQSYEKQSKQHAYNKNKYGYRRKKA